jgi:predicted RNase H-like nuclease (RuvC/YqgF family)
MVPRSGNDMAGHTEHIRRIEEKVSTLAGAVKRINKENEKLRKELETQLKQNETLKSQFEQLQLQVALQQTERGDAVQKTSNAALEKKINEYIKEIDRCITLLGETD